jgi:membrane-bound serine protease (ClpP class)
MRPTLVFAASLASLAAAPAAAVPPAWSALGMTGWTPALLVLAGVLMVAVEVFVIPGFGWTGFLGLLALVGGVILAVAPGPTDAAVAFATLVASLTLMGLAVWAVASRLRAGHPLFGGILSQEEGYVATTRRPELEGIDGVTLTDLRPAGVAEIGGERMDVVSEGGWIPAGTPVRMLRSEGYRHVVRAVALPPAADETPEG